MIGIIMIRKMKMIRNNYDHDYDAVQEHIWYLRKALNSVNASPIVEGKLSCQLLTLSIIRYSINIWIHIHLISLNPIRYLPYAKIICD